MDRGFVLVFVLVFLMASGAMTAKPVSGESSVVGNTWIERASLQVARAFLGVAGVNGKIYAIGGSTASGFAPASFPYGNIDLDHFAGTNEEYDPKTNTWTYKAPMPTPRMAFAIAAIQGKIYCIGGRSISGDRNGGYTAVNEVYNPATDSWETKAPMPIAAGWIEAHVVDGKIYVRESRVRDSSSNFSVYDSETNTWATSVPASKGGKLLLNEIPHGYATTGIMTLKMIYTFNSDPQAYNPENDSWVSGAANPTPYRQGYGVAILEDTFYLVGGYNYEPWGPFAPVGINEEYIPIGYGTPDPSYVLEHTPPTISILSPQNQTYNNSSVSLFFSVNKAINWTSYSLDGKQNVTSVNNTTMTELPNGLHNITIYAEDNFGNVGASETVNFTIAKPEPFPTSPVTAVSLAVLVLTVIIVFLLLYRKHRKNVNVQKSNLLGPPSFNQKKV